MKFKLRNTLILVPCVLLLYPTVLNADENKPSLACTNGNYFLSGNLVEVKKCLEEGLSVHAILGNGASGVYLATLYGHFELVKYLVERGASVNTPDRCGRTPLIVACCTSNQKLIDKKRFAKVAKYLIDHGADVNVRVRCSPYAIEGDKSVWTPLRCAKDTGTTDPRVLPDAQMINYLKSKGATE